MMMMMGMMMMVVMVVMAMFCCNYQCSARLCVHHSGWIDKLTNKELAPVERVIPIFLC